MYGEKKNTKKGHGYYEYYEYSTVRKKNTMYFLYCGNWPPGLNPCFRVATLRSSPRRRDRLRTCKSLANHAAKARIGFFTAACGGATSPSAETPISPDYGRWPRGLFSKKKSKHHTRFGFFFLLQSRISTCVVAPRTPDSVASIPSRRGRRLGYTTGRIGARSPGCTHGRVDGFSNPDSPSPRPVAS